MMDDADFRLLAHLFRDPFASYRELGQELALSGPAARNRLERLAESGVLRGFQVLPSAEVMGRTHVMWEYPEPRERPESSKVLTIEDVAWAVEWHDNSWTVHAFVRRPRERPPATLDALMGAPGRAAHPLAETDPGDADPDAVLSPLDWRLIAALATEPRATAVRLAQESGLSPKSVRARRAALVEGTGGARRDMAGVPGRKGELPHQSSPASGVARDAPVALGVGALQVGIGHQAGAPVTGTGHVDHVQVPVPDHPVQVGVDEVEARRRPPVPE